MSDTTDGSSAAHGAQDIQDDEPRGLFSRLFDAFSPDEAESHGERLGRTLPGLANLQRMRVEDVSSRRQKSWRCPTNPVCKISFSNSATPAIPASRSSRTRSTSPRACCCSRILPFTTASTAITIWTSRHCCAPSCMSRRRCRCRFCCARCRPTAVIWRWSSTNMAASTGWSRSKTCWNRSWAR